MSISARRMVVFITATILTGCAGGVSQQMPAPPVTLALPPLLVRPGDVVHVALPHGQLTSRQDLHATIGGEPSVILRIPDDEHVDIVVPIVPPDTVTLVLGDRNGTLASGDLRVGPTANALIVLSVTDSVRVVRVVPTVDRPTENVLSSEDRLSFDLVDHAGNLVHTCSVLDPTRVPGETLAPGSAPDQLALQRAGVSGDAVVGIRVPRPPGAALLKAFRVAPGLDIRTEGGRAQRTLISQVAVPF